jgi:hypothetical protein
MSKSERSTSQRKLFDSYGDVCGSILNMIQIAGNHPSELGIFLAERNQWTLPNQSLLRRKGRPSRQHKDTLPPPNYRSVDRQASPVQKSKARLDGAIIVTFQSKFLSFELFAASYIWHV